MRRKTRKTALLLAVAVTVPTPARAQILESVGSRALGMGGAFVAVADDSSGVWWNPGALAAGPFVDGAIGLASAEARGPEPAARTRPLWFTLSTPVVGAGYYRFRLTEIAPAATGSAVPDRETGGTGKSVRALEASQVGVTLVQSLVSGVHVGTTLKYVRGTLRAADGPAGANRDTLFELGRSLTGGVPQGRFDLDLGAIAVAGPIRLGAVVRNLRQVSFESEGNASVAPMRLPRQVRIGFAVDGSKLGEMPLMVAVDADAVTYTTGLGDRRVVAVGAERWWFGRRLGLRAGGRFNQVGRRERSGTAGASVAVRSGMFVEGHLAAGGSADERGWGIGARVSF